MDAPLARHLSRFSRLPPAGASAAAPVAVAPIEPAQPTVIMTASEFEAKLDAARAAARADLQASHAAEVSSLRAAHADALAAAVAAETARQVAEHGAEAAEGIATAAATLRDAVAADVAAVLRPIVAAALADRTLAALVEAIERALADPDRPLLTIRGPQARLEAVEAALGARVGVTLVAADGDELLVTANGTRIETRLAAALAAISGSEPA